MRLFAIASMLAMAAGLGLAQPPAAAFTEGQILPLWEKGAPGALGKDDTDIPTIAVYRAAQRPDGTAVIIAPGGGYSGLSMSYEGRQEANWFNAMGVSAFVLKYRLGPRYHHPIELGDAQRAIRTVRACSVRNLLGANPDPHLIEDLSNVLRVTPQTPPTFLFHTANDPAVPVENSVRFFLALRKAKVPAEMHIFENGPHGVGMALGDPSLSQWTPLLLNWLRSRGLLTVPAVRNP